MSYAYLVGFLIEDVAAAHRLSVSATQPRGPGANRATTTRAAQELQDLLNQAGFTHTRVHTLSTHA